MSDLTAFLAARLDEDEREAAGHAGPPSLLARQRREVEAKRAILAAHPIRPISNGTCEACSAPDGSSYLGGLEEFIDWPCPTLRALAAIWRDHPDYPWRGHEGGPP